MKGTSGRREAWATSGGTETHENSWVIYILYNVYYIYHDYSIYRQPNLPLPAPASHSPCPFFPASCPPFACSASSDLPWPISGGDVATLDTWLKGGARGKGSPAALPLLAHYLDTLTTVHSASDTPT